MRLWTDFHDIEEDDTIWADLDYAEFFFEHELRVGNRAELTDGAGHECLGAITEVDRNRRMVWLKIDWDTWHFTGHPERQKKFGSSRDYAAVFVH